MRVLFGLMMVFLFGCASAQSAEFSHLGTVKVAQLNEILSAERAKFLPADSMGAQYQYPQAGEAKNDVEIYRVSYDSVIPELNNKPVRASGLVAIPKSLQSKAAPLISYQHGTVFGKYEVPSYAFETRNPSGHSHYDGAYETRLMVAQFAGNGYILMAADYFGLGDSTASEGYMVKASSQQACNDLYHAVIKFLADKHIQPTSFYLGGWSQGGLVTTGFLQKLETDGIKVDAAFTASSPNDPYAAIIGRALAAPAGRVTLRSPFGGARIVDMLVGDHVIASQHLDGRVCHVVASDEGHAERGRERSLVGHRGVVVSDT